MECPAFLSHNSLFLCAGPCRGKTGAPDLPDEVIELMDPAKAGAEQASLFGLLHDIGRYAGVSSERHLTGGCHHALRQENLFISFVVTSTFIVWTDFESICSINSLAAVLPI